MAPTETPHRIWKSSFPSLTSTSSAPTWNAPLTPPPENMTARLIATGLGYAGRASWSKVAAAGAQDPLHLPEPDERDPVVETAPDQRGTRFGELLVPLLDLEGDRPVD